jgi:hypothetical protein
MQPRNRAVSAAAAILPAALISCQAAKTKVHAGDEPCSRWYGVRTISACRSQGEVTGGASSAINSARCPASSPMPCRIADLSFRSQGDSGNCGDSALNSSPADKYLAMAITKCAVTVVRCGSTAGPLTRPQRARRRALPDRLDFARRDRSDSPNPLSFWRVALSERLRARAIRATGIF